MLIWQNALKVFLQTFPDDKQFEPVQLYNHLLDKYYTNSTLTRTELWTMCKLLHEFNESMANNK